METVFIVVPTTSASWTTLFAAVMRAMLSSKVLLPAASAEAERRSASPTPSDEMAKLLPTSLNLSTMVIAFSASMPNAFIVEIILSDAWLTSSIPSPTFLYTSAASANCAASSSVYPRRAKSADAVTVSAIVAPSFLARTDASSRYLA